MITMSEHTLTIGDMRRFAQMAGGDTISVSNLFVEMSLHVGHLEDILNAILSCIQLGLFVTSPFSKMLWVRSDLDFSDETVVT